MKKLLSLLLVSIMILTTVTGCSTTGQPDDSKNEAVVLTGSAEAYHGDITVEVTMNGETISEVTISSHTETEGVGTNAIDQLPGEIVAKQSIVVDTIGGATLSSNGILAAVETALVDGGYDISKYQSTSTETTKEEVTMHADIVVVGTGLSGLSAALTSAEAGAKVVMLEKMSFPGGSTALAGGNITAVGTYAQEEAGIEDSVELALNDWKVAQSTHEDLSGGLYPNYDLVEQRLSESGSVVNWFMDMGYPFVVASSNGDPVAENRRVINPDGKGADLVAFLVEKAGENNIEIIYNARATKLVNKDGTIKGVYAEGKDSNITVNADAVILASGGFAASQELTERFTPDVAQFVKYNTGPASNTGDGFLLAEEVGAVFYEGPWYQTGAGVNPLNSTLNTLENQGKHIMVNSEGVRYANEKALLREVYPYVISEAQGGTFLVFDSSEPFVEHVAAIEADIDHAEEYFKADTVGELAQLAGINEEALVETVNTYNEGNDPFGKDEKFFAELSTGPYYAVKAYPNQNETLGGIKVDEEQNVLNANGDTIPGLYAVGELVFRPYFNVGNMSAVSLMLSSTTGVNGANGALGYISSK